MASLFLRFDLHFLDDFHGISYKNYDTIAGTITLSLNNVNKESLSLGVGCVRSTKIKDTLNVSFDLHEK